MSRIRTHARGLQWPYESRERRSNLKRTTRRIGETDFAYENEQNLESLQ